MGCGCLPWPEQKAWGALAWPISVVFICRFLMDLTDLAFVGHLAKDPRFPTATPVDFLAAAGISLTWINITSIPLWRGFCPSLVTLASQAFYNDDKGHMQMYLQMALFFSTLFCWALVPAWWYSGAVARWALGPAVCTELCADLVTSFTRYSVVWLWPMVAFDQLEGLLQCQGETLPAMAINVFFVLVNVGLNKVCVFGLHLPELGIHIDGFGFIGSPIATGLTRWMRTIVFTLYLTVRDIFAYWRVGVELWSIPHLLTYLRQCIAMGVGGCFEEWQIHVVSLVAGRLGLPAMAAHSAFLQVFLVVDSLMFGPMNATTIKITHFMTNGDVGRCKEVLRYAFGFTGALALGIATGFVLLRDSIGSIFTSDPELRDVISRLAPIAAGCYVLLCLGLTSLAALDAQCRPVAMASIFLVGGWAVATPLAWFLSSPLKLGLPGVWYGMLSGYAMIVVLGVITLLRSNWDSYTTQAQLRNAGGIDDDIYEAESSRERSTSPILTSSDL